MNDVLNVVLTHQKPAAVARMLDWWREVVPAETILLAHGGRSDAFAGVGFRNKIPVSCPRLRTTNHQRERQSYTDVFHSISDWLRGRDFNYVYFAEYDHLPLAKDLNARQLVLLNQEGADVLGHELLQVDGSNQPHYLYHRSLPGFEEFWSTLSCRTERGTVLSMFGSGTFWTREAFEAVAAVQEPFPVYLEIWLPTLAHHLGFRIREFPEDRRHIRGQGELENLIPEARAAGVWTLHPVKRLWLDSKPGGL